MCGLVGFARAKNTTTTVDSDLAEFFRAAMTVGVLRGVDSFGTYFGHGDGGIKYSHISKFPVSASALAGTPVFEDMLRRAKVAQVAIGHHRAKTTGVISQEAAHPYCVYSSTKQRFVYGAHNGSLTSWYGGQGSKTFATDSEWLFQEIADKGPEVLRDIKGAYAVAFVMSDRPNKLFLARNKERPLSFGVSDDGKFMVYGSEYPMLEWLTGRGYAALKMDTKYAAKAYTWADVEPLKLWEFDLDNLKNPVSEVDLTPPKVQAVTHQYSVSTTPHWKTGKSSFATIAGSLKAVYNKANETELETAHEWGEVGTVIQFRVKQVHEKNGNITHVLGVCEESPFHMPTIVLLRQPDPVWHPYLRDKDRVFSAAIHGVLVRTAKPGFNEVRAAVGDPLSSTLLPQAGAQLKVVGGN
jgi:hypothetical protein